MDSIGVFPSSTGFNQVSAWKKKLTGTKRFRRKGTEVARQEVAVRICSCPGRDVKNEEDRFRKKTYSEPPDLHYGESRSYRVS